jgi:hypothetical protein
MATIHTGTTMVPTKLELLTAWLPRQPWHAGGTPLLSKAGGFRLDDPAGEVGIEVMFVGDGEKTVYAVPMTYRAAPLAGADDALIGTSVHGVLGTRWIYDAAHDPVAVAELLELVCGRADAQHQSASDTPDRSVDRRWSSTDGPAAVVPLRVRDSERGRTTVAVELTDPSSARRIQGSLHLLRVLEEGAPVDDDDIGVVTADWIRPDGTTGRGPVAVVR